ncbi:hypothetical protein [Streptomyces sp. NPDC059783]|uniref:hypothetical protein n=1 Tax=Streptomyces sp. NPDC059783 TaxID=3346944 RepID=UPI0036683908
MDVVSPRTLTQATVVRAGRRTTLVALPCWYKGLILVPVETGLVMMITGLERDSLPDTELLVRARLGARSEGELDLGDWQPAGPSRPADSDAA